MKAAMVADVINAPEGGDTKGKTGTYFGLWALSTKLATALGAAGSLPVAELLGFNPARGHYDKTALIVKSFDIRRGINTRSQSLWPHGRRVFSRGWPV